MEKGYNRNLRLLLNLSLSNKKYPNVKETNNYSPLKPGVLREELSDLLEETANIFLPKDKFELITDHIVDKNDLLYTYFEKLVYPLLQT